VLRPGLSVCLVEPIAKKVAFLRTAVRELGLGGRVTVEARRAESVRDGGGGVFDAAVSRATLAPPAWLSLGASLVRAGGQIFVLASEDAALSAPGVQPVLSRRYRGGRRWLLVFRRV
jgi:16S rRNA (guanine527-N7)-methyltransferase